MAEKRFQMVLLFLRLGHRNESIPCRTGKNAAYEFKNTITEMRRFRLSWFHRRQLNLFSRFCANPPRPVVLLVLGFVNFHVVLLLVKREQQVRYGGQNCFHGGCDATSNVHHADLRFRLKNERNMVVVSIEIMHKCGLI